MGRNCVNEIMKRRWLEYERRKTEVNNRSVLRRVGLNESILDDVGETEAGSSQKLSEKHASTYEKYLLLQVDGLIRENKRDVFLREAESVPFEKLCFQYHDIINNCAFVKDCDITASMYCDYFLFLRVRERASMNVEDYITIDLTGESGNRPFVDKCRFIMDEKDALKPEDKTTHVMLTLSCGFVPRSNVTLNQIIRGLRNVKRFTILFGNVMRDLLEINDMTFEYFIPREKDSIIKFVDYGSRVDMSVYYGPLYDFAAEITGDKEKYSRSRLERY